MPPENSRCPVCAAIETRVFLVVSRVPIHCNVPCPTRGAAVRAPRGDIRLTLCEGCGHIYNSVFDPSLMDYTEGYENSLHFSPRFQQYANWLVSALVERYKLHGKKIVEIGCGNGDFLRLLCETGRNRGIGFDPSFNGGDEDEQAEQDIRIIRDFYSERYAEYEADLICCRHVLEHIGDPRDFLSQLRRAIGPRETLVYFEVPNVLFMLKDLGIWDIIYEHCSYLSRPSAAYLFQSAGFVIQRVYATFGGQFLCLEAMPASSTEAQSLPVQDDIQQLSVLASYFCDAYRARVDEWSDRLSKLLKQGKRVTLWGAGSKGVTFLNTVPGGVQIECVVDINPRKQGKWVAGTGQEIVSPESLPEYSPDTILVTNPMYKGEIEKTTNQMGIMSEIVVV